MKNKFLKALLQHSNNTDGLQTRLNDLCSYHKYENAPSVDKIVLLLDQFIDCVGYTKNRRTTNTIELDKEGGIQDMIYLMLKPSVPDLLPEQPISDKLRQFAIQDFRSKGLRLIIEAKIIRDKNHGKLISKELHDDIGNYKSDPFCDDLIFFIYDPNHFLESPTGIIGQVKGVHSHDGYKLRVHCIIK